MGKSRQIEVISRGLLIEENAILVCRNVQAGYAFLPGGHVEFGEPAKDALRREFDEECGLEVRVGDCVLLTEETFEHGGRLHHEINVVFHVERKGTAESRPQISSRESKIAFDWLVLSAVARNDMRPASIRAWLANHVAHGAGLPTAAWLTGMGR